MSGSSAVVSEKTVGELTDRFRSTRPQAEPTEATTLGSLFRSALFRLMAGADFRSPQRASTIQPDAVQNVLIIRPDAIGDYVVTTPLLSWLAAAVPHAAIHMVCSQRTHALVRADPRVDRLVAIDDQASVTKNLRAIRSFVKGTDYQVVFAVAPYRVTRSAFYALAAGRKPIRAAVEQSRRNALYKEFFDVMIPHQYPLRHWCESMAMAGGLTISSTTPVSNAPSLGLPPEHPPAKGDEFLVLNISAHEVKRQLGSKQAIALARLILESQPDLNVHVISGPADRVRAQDIVVQINNQRCVLVQSTLEELPSLMERALIVLTPDTGVLHLACAVETPVVAFYLEEIKVIEWGPYGVPFRALISKTGSMDSIEPDQIHNEAVALLQQVRGLP